MNIQIRRITLAAMVCICSALFAQVADPEPDRSDSKMTREKAQQLLKDLNDARPKAEAAEQQSRNAGVRPPTESGFAKAKALRDEQAVTAYERYIKTTREMEIQIKEQAQAGRQPFAAKDIARFERLQAEVDLARIQGWLPAQETTETALARQRARAALGAELMKHEEGKSTLPNVFQAAKDLRTVEEQLGTNWEQRVQAHMRYVGLVQELKKETDSKIAPPEGKLVAQELTTARSELQGAIRNK
jgi:hypothetical protein